MPDIAYQSKRLQTKTSPSQNVPKPKLIFSLGPYVNFQFNEDDFFLIKTNAFNSVSAN